MYVITHNAILAIIVRHNARNVNAKSVQRISMTQGLTKNASTIQEALQNLHLDCQVFELPSSTRTAADAAASIGCNVAQIAKSLIFKTSNTYRPVLVLASGVNQVDEQKIEDHIGENISKADAAFTKETTGFTIGGIPPIGHKNTIGLIFIDQDLLSLDEVWAAAGTLNAVFCIQSKDLITITGGKIIALAKTGNSS